MKHISGMIMTGHMSIRSCTSYEHWGIHSLSLSFIAAGNHKDISFYVVDTLYFGHGHRH